MMPISSVNVSLGEPAKTAEPTVVSFGGRKNHVLQLNTYERHLANTTKYKYDLCAAAVRAVATITVATCFKRQLYGEDAGNIAENCSLVSIIQMCCRVQLPKAVKLCYDKIIQFLTEDDS